MKNLLKLFFLAFSCGANASMSDVATCVNVQSNAYQMLKNVGNDKGADDYLNNYIQLKMVGDRVFGEPSFAIALRNNSFKSNQPSVVLDKIATCQIRMEVFAKQYYSLKDIAECASIFIDLNMVEESISYSLKGLDILGKEAFDMALTQGIFNSASLSRDSKLLRIKTCGNLLNK